MENQDYIQLMNDALARNETIVFSCNCTIRYSGRAESYLPEGDRVIMIKSDTALLVHQPTGNTPINYMKPGTSHTARMEHEQIHFKSQNLLQKENMIITINRIHFFNSHKLEDGQTIRISGTEEDMSNMIYANPEIIEQGLKPVSQEEQTKYGFIDVLCVDKNSILTVIECKRYRAELSAVTQLRRYVEKIMINKGITQVRGILAAPKITENAKKMLEDWEFMFKPITPPKYLEEYDKKQSKLGEY